MLGKSKVLGGLVALAVVAGSAIAAPAEESSLEVVIKDVRSDQGSLRIALWSDPKGFTETDAILLESSAPASSGEKAILFKDIEPGLYALIAYHDENGNGEFDKTFIGLPAEGLGFSNGAWIRAFGPPSFEEAAIEVKGPTNTTIGLRY
ncbi:MAG: DUF2141 domain-containing protein [Kiloniellales bacterium]|nr:DUF2141 domain-containing protein [Kiloniellales bacterium]